MKPKTIKYKIIAGNKIKCSAFLQLLLAITPSPKDICKLYLEFLDIKYLAELKETRIERAAREIMGENYIGRRELAEIFGDILMGEEIEQIPALPANIMEILQSSCPFKKGNNRICDTHVLFLMPKTIQGKPLTITRWHDLEKQHQSFHQGKLLRDHIWYKDEGLYKDEEFAFRPARTEWVLMPKEMVPDTAGKVLDKLRGELQKYQAYETIDAVSFITGIILYYLKTGNRLYGEEHMIMHYHKNLMPYALTHDFAKALACYRVCVGGFDADGLNIQDPWCGLRGISVLAVRRQFKKDINNLKATEKFFTYTIRQRSRVLKQTQNACD